MLDADLAGLYEVETRALVQSVKRNAERFPVDFMFRPKGDEAARSRSQIVILNAQAPEITTASGSKPDADRRGTNLKYLPYAFTEQG